MMTEELKIFNYVKGEGIQQMTTDLILSLLICIMSCPLSHSLKDLYVIRERFTFGFISVLIRSRLSKDKG